MTSPRRFVPVVCTALLVACTSQQEASTRERAAAKAAPSATPAPTPVAVPVATPVTSPVATPVATPVASAPSASADTRGLFITFCAACHGETGDGNGTTKLDRPARSFKDGGFSYGNTPDAIAKTLAYGIPGSVMPSFGKTLSDEQRIALAKYVIELGPQDMPTESPDRVMVVKDRAVVASGKLPPLVEGGEEIPRGLLVGTPDGFTFAYRTDDLRLIAVYQGEFAERTDWMGRGGTQLKPLGKLVASFGMNAPASFETPNAKGAAPLVFRATEVSGALVRVSASIDAQRGAMNSRGVQVTESARVRTHELGTGWTRHFRFENRGSNDAELVVRPAELVLPDGQIAGADAGVANCVARGAAGAFDRTASWRQLANQSVVLDEWKGSGALVDPSVDGRPALARIRLAPGASAEGDWSTLVGAANVDLVSKQWLTFQLGGKQ